jgi:hypothetical protein
MSARPPESGTIRLPEPVLNRLNATIARIRRIIVIRGALAVSSVAFGAILCIMAIDAATTIFSTAVRWGMTLTALCAVVAAAYAFLYRPLSEKWTPRRVARLLETRHPEMEESISSAIELLAADDAEMYRGSERLLARLAEEASRDVGLVSPDKEFTTRTAKPYKIALAAFAGILLLLFAQAPATTARLFARAVAPSLRLGNAYAGILTVTPADITIPEGDPLEIAAVLSDRRAARAELISEFPDGARTVERMRREDNAGQNRYSIAIPSVRQSFRYRVLAGRALSGYCRVNAVPRPAVSRLDVLRRNPAYTGLQPRTEDVTAVERISVLAGSKIEFTAQLNKPVSSAEMTLRGEPVPPADRAADSVLTTGLWNLDVGAAAEPAPLMVRLTDEHGIVNRPRRQELLVVKDEPPTVLLVEPVELTLRMQPKDILPVLYAAGDDFGIAESVMLIRLDGNAIEPRPLPPPVQPEPGKPAWVGRDVLDLSTLPLGSARVLTVQLEVRDNLPPDREGPQKALSKVITIQIDRSAESLAKQTLAAQQSAIRQALENTGKRLEEARNQAGQNIKTPLSRKNEMTGQVKKAADMVQKHAASAEAAMNELAEKVQDTAFAKLAPKMEETSKDDIAPARRDAELMQLTEKPEDPLSTADEMVDKLDDALAAVEELKKDLSEAAIQAEYVADLAEVARKERRLAQQAADQSLAQQLRDSWQQQQQDAERQLAQLANESPDALKQQIAQQLRRAQELARDALALASKQQKAMEAELAIDDPDRHGDAAAALAQVQPSSPGDNLDRHLAQAQRRIQTDAGRLADRSRDLNDISRNTAMDQDARNALEQAAQALNQAQQHAAAAADNLQNRSEQNPPAPGDAKRALERASEDARRDAVRKSQEAAREKQEARDANAVAENAARKADEAERAALAADAAHKQDAQQAAATARQEADKARQESERQMREASAAQQAGKEADQRAKDADEAVHAVEKQQSLARKSMEAAAQALRQMDSKLDSQIAVLDALQAQRQAREKQQAAAKAQEEATEAQQDAMLARMNAQRVTEQEPGSPHAAESAARAQQEQSEATEKQRSAEAAQEEAMAAQRKANDELQRSIAAGQTMRQAGAAMKQAQESQEKAVENQRAAMEAQAQSGEPREGQPQQGQNAGQPRQAQQAAHQAQAAAQHAQERAMAAQQQAAKELALQALPQQGERSEQVADMTRAQDFDQALSAVRSAANPPPRESPPEQASQTMSRAAQHASEQVESLARQAARSMGMPESQMPMGRPSSPNSQPSEPGQANPDGKGIGKQEEWKDVPMILRTLGISMADWIRISGWLRSDVSSEGARNTSPEYRELVRNYFREIARRSGAETDAGSAGDR